MSSVICTEDIRSPDVLCASVRQLAKLTSQILGIHATASRDKLVFFATDGSCATYRENEQLYELPKLEVLGGQFVSSAFCDEKLLCVHENGRVYVHNDNSIISSSKYHNDNGNDNDNDNHNYLQVRREMIYISAVSNARVALVTKRGSLLVVELSESGKDGNLVPAETSASLRVGDLLRKFSSLVEDDTDEDAQLATQVEQARCVLKVLSNTAVYNNNSNAASTTTSTNTGERAKRASFEEDDSTSHN